MSGMKKAPVASDGAFLLGLFRWLNARADLRAPLSNGGVGWWRGERLKA
jgi:hypothetical protein